MNTAATVKQTTCLCRDTGGKGMLPAQHTAFNTLDNWAIKPPPNQKGKGPERKGYRVMARNMYTIHSVTGPFTSLLYFQFFFCILKNYRARKYSNMLLTSLSQAIGAVSNGESSQKIKRPRYVVFYNKVRIWNWIRWLGTVFSHIFLYIGFTWIIVMISA